MPAITSTPPISDREIEGVKGNTDRGRGGAEEPFVFSIGLLPFFCRRMEFYPVSGGLSCRSFFWTEWSMPSVGVAFFQRRRGHRTSDTKELSCAVGGLEEPLGRDDDTGHDARAAEDTHVEAEAHELTEQQGREEEAAWAQRDREMERDTERVRHHLQREPTIHREDNDR